MRIGAIYPQIDLGRDPGPARAYAQAVEGLGYRHITCFDQVVGLDRNSFERWPYVHDSEDTFHEIFVLFGFLAALTERVELATGVVVLPQRQTALVAKQAAEVDVLSGGRLRLGIGVGIKPEEFQALDIDYRHRGRRCDEQMEVMRLLWTNELINYDGRWHHIHHGGINPLPVQQPIPIWIGGHSEPVLRRIARSAEGWMPNFEPDANGVAIIERLHRYVREHGRDPSEIGIEATVNVLDRTPEQWREDALAWQLAGATHLSVNTMQEEWDEAAGMWSKAKGATLTESDEHIAVLERYLEVIGDLAS